MKLRFPGQTINWTISNGVLLYYAPGRPMILSPSVIAPACTIHGPAAICKNQEADFQGRKAYPMTPHIKSPLWRKANGQQVAWSMQCNMCGMEPFPPGLAEKPDPWGRFHTPLLTHPSTLPILPSHPSPFFTPYLKNSFIYLITFSFCLILTVFSQHSHFVRFS